MPYAALRLLPFSLVLSNKLRAAFHCGFFAAFFAATQKNSVNSSSNNHKLPTAPKSASASLSFFHMCNKFWRQ